MRAKSLLLLMLALGCGLVASIGITQVMAKRTAVSAVPAAEMTTIFVALDDIPMGDPVTPQLIKLEQWPKDKIPPGAMTKLEDVENRRPKTKIYKGTPIVENLLLPKGSNQGATAQIPKGYRVVAVKVDDVSATSSMIRPGDRVDLMVYVQRNPAKGIDTTKTQTILEDLKVFAVNDVYGLDKGQEKITARTISLLVTPGQAEKVALASEMGSVRLVMRSFDDDTQVNSTGAVPEDIFGSTEAADRTKDDPIKEIKPAPGTSTAAVAGDKPADQSKDFLDFLKSKQPDLAPAPAMEGPREPNDWKIRVIAANQVNDVVLKLENQPSSGAPTRGQGQWTTSPATPDTDAPNTAMPADASPQVSQTPPDDLAQEPRPQPQKQNGDSPAEPSPAVQDEPATDADGMQPVPAGD